VLLLESFEMSNQNMDTIMTNEIQLHINKNDKMYLINYSNVFE
jgi:hypothetical protein